MKKPEQTRQRYAGNERSLEPLSLKPSIASHSQNHTTKNVPLSSIFNIVLNEVTNTSRGLVYTPTYKPNNKRGDNVTLVYFCWRTQ